MPSPQGSHPSTAFHDLLSQCVVVLEQPPGGRMVGGGTGIPTLVLLLPPPAHAEPKYVPFIPPLAALPTSTICA